MNFRFLQSTFRTRTSPIPQSAIGNRQSAIVPLLLCAFASLALCVAAFADSSPFLIPFQGRLTNPQGVPYTNGQYTVIFNLYDQPVGGTVLWSETHQKIGVINGMVNVFLGSINQAITKVDFSQTRHLGITIDADGNPNTPDPEMVPRQMIIPAFWAKNSEKLNGYDWSAIFGTGTNSPVGPIPGGKIQNGSITAGQIANNTITAAQLAMGAVGSNQMAAGAVTGAAIASGAIGSNQIALSSISSDRLAPRAVGTNVPLGGVAISPSCANFTANNPLVTSTITNFNLNLFTGGNPVEVFFTSDGTTNTDSYFQILGPTASSAITLFLLRDGKQVGAEDSDFGVDLSGVASSFAVPPGAFRFVDFPPAGFHNYQVQILGWAQATRLQANNMRMIAREF